MTPSENRIKRRLVFLAFSFCGLMAMAIGMLVVLYFYAFATISAGRLGPGEVREVDYWREILKDMFLSPSVVPVLFGLILAVGGAFAAIWNAAVAIGLVVTAVPTRRTLLAVLVGLLVVLAIGVLVVALS